MAGARLTSDEIQAIQKAKFRLPIKKEPIKYKRLVVSSVPVGIIKKLKQKAKELGCDVSYLVKTYIQNGLEGVVMSATYTQTRTVSQTRQQEIKFTPKADKQPANYAQPAYFAELKAVLEKRKKKISPTAQP